MDEFEYSFIDDCGEKIRFKVKEKRVVSYTPAFAKKRKHEIQKQIERASNFISLKDMTREELHDAAKFVRFETLDKDGKQIEVAKELDQSRIDQEMALAGYNLIVTSEIDKTPEDIYEACHGLWRIEECFRITKTYLEARPVYVRKEETIYGHFLICYYALVFLRLLEFKIFKNTLMMDEIIRFIRKFNVTETPDGTYINTATMNRTYATVKQVTGLSKLGNMYLSKRDTDNIMKNCELALDLRSRS